MRPLARKPGTGLIFEIVRVVGKAWSPRLRRQLHATLPKHGTDRASVAPEFIGDLAGTPVGVSEVAGKDIGARHDRLRTWKPTRFFDISASQIGPTVKLIPAHHSTIVMNVCII